jgi:hypothetical protein
MLRLCRKASTCLGSSRSARFSGPLPRVRPIRATLVATSRINTQPDTARQLRSFLVGSLSHLEAANDQRNQKRQRVAREEEHHAN